MGLVKNKRRFLRRLYRFYWYELVYSEVLPEWKLGLETNKARRWLLKQNLWPKEVVNIVNITLVLEKYYNQPINRKTVKMATGIYKKWDKEIIKPYMLEKWNKVCEYRKELNLPIINITKEQALAEQVARGFIKKVKFKKYKKGYRHCLSIVDRELIYPRNFGWGLKTKKINVLRALELVGVSGFTRITQ